MAVGPLGQVHISVRDVDRSVEFYRDVLGMDFLFRVPGQPMAFFASGDVRLYLGTPERPEFTSKCVLYFRVDDIDTAVARVRELGGQVLSVGEYDSGGNAECVDDQGQRFDLFRAKPGY